MWNSPRTSGNSPTLGKTKYNKHRTNSLFIKPPDTVFRLPVETPFRSTHDTNGSFGCCYLIGFCFYTSPVLPPYSFVISLPMICKPIMKLTFLKASTFPLQGREQDSHYTKIKLDYIFTGVSSLFSRKEKLWTCQKLWIQKPINLSLKSICCHVDGFS